MHVSIMILAMVQLIYHPLEVQQVCLHSMIYSPVLINSISGRTIHVIHLLNPIVGMFQDVKVTSPLLYILTIVFHSFSVDRTRDIGYTLGLQENVLWMNMNPTADGIPSIVYRSPSLSRHLIVQLICNRSYSTAQLLVLGETSLGEYTMQLTSRCACWNECQSTPDPDPFNWNFAIILVCIGGVAFLFFCIIVTCLICSKPKRRYPRRIITDERTALFAAERKHESKI